MSIPLTTLAAIASGVEVVGCKVVVVGYGGGIPLHTVRSVGEVVRVNRNGFPVVVVGGFEYTDRDGCTAVLDGDGAIVRV